MCIPHLITFALVLTGAADELDECVRSKVLIDEAADQENTVFQESKRSWQLVDSQKLVSPMPLDVTADQHHPVRPPPPAAGMMPQPSGQPHPAPAQPMMQPPPPVVCPEVMHQQAPFPAVIASTQLWGLQAPAQLQQPKINLGGLGAAKWGYMGSIAGISRPQVSRMHGAASLTAEQPAEQPATLPAAGKRAVGQKRKAPMTTLKEPAHQKAKEKVDPSAGRAFWEERVKVSVVACAVR